MPSLAPTDRSIADFEARLRSADPRLRRYARGVVGPSAVDDVLQDAYLKAFRSYGRFRGDAAFDTWLFRIVHNTCVNHLRASRTDYELDEARTVLAATGQADRAVDRLDLVNAFDALPCHQREAVLLVIVEGYSYDTVAEILGVRRGTVASRVNRARRTLMGCLTGGGSA